MIGVIPTVCVLEDKLRDCQGGGERGMAKKSPSSIIHHPTVLSVVSCQLSVVGSLLSVVGCRSVSVLFSGWDLGALSGFAFWGSCDH